LPYSSVPRHRGVEEGWR